jgi:hypothetical protein
LKPVSPPKLECIESVNNQEIQMHVEVLEDIMRNMEREMYLLKSPFLLKQGDQNKSSKDSDSTTTDNMFSDEDFDTGFHMNNSRLPSRSDNASTSWQLKFRKDGNISINTDILSYSNLLKHIEALGTTANIFPIVKQPTLASLSAGGGYLYRHILCSVLRKGNFKATLQCIQNVQQRQQRFISSFSSFTTPSTLLIEAENAAPNIVFEKKDLALQLVNTYFSCRFHHRVIFHQKTFFDLFVNKRADLESSPVVCALAAAVLTMHCKHVLAIVPFDQQLALGDYYFNKARYAVSLQFDEPSMETMITYLHMSLYKVNLLRPQDANMYLEIAIRIRQILADGIYKHPPQPYINTNNNITNTSNNNTNTYITTSTTTTTTAGTDLIESTPLPKRPTKSKALNRYLGEYETFKRLHAGFQDVVQFIQFVNNQRGVPVKSTNSRNKPSICNKENTTFQKLFQAICAELYDPKPMPDESRQTIRAIMKERYIGLIVKAVGPYFSKVRFGEDDMIPLSFLMKTEEDLKNVYYQQIPLDYRLAPSIFEDNLDDAEFKKRLGEDGRCDIVSVTLAARYYQSLLALHEPFLPVIRRPPTLIDLSLIQENIEPDSPKKRKKRKRKPDGSPNTVSTACTLSSSSSSEEDEEVLSVHDLRAQEVCYRCAIIVVRLLEYQCTALQACTIPTPSLLCAWDILMRNSCLGMTEFDLEESGVTKYLTAKDIQLSREYAVRCIEVLRRGYMFNGAERDLWEYYEKIESQLLTALCQSASPTAKYWEPVENW